MTALEQAFAALGRVAAMNARFAEEQRRQDARQAAKHYLPRHWWRLGFGGEAPRDRQARIAILRRAIAGERRSAGHWTYDANRLVNLRGAYLAERLAALRDRKIAREAA